MKIKTNKEDWLGTVFPLVMGTMLWVITNSAGIGVIVYFLSSICGDVWRIKKILLAKK